jgi:hypothetical protein
MDLELGETGNYSSSILETAQGHLAAHSLVLVLAVKHELQNAGLFRYI